MPCNKKKKYMMSGIFFSKNKKTASARLKKLAGTEGSMYKGKTPVLAKKQIKHSSGWKTWKMVKKKRY